MGAEAPAGGVSRLAVIAPEHLWVCLRAGLRAFYGDLLVLPAKIAGSTDSDPYGVAEVARTLVPRPDAILLVASRRNSPARLLPAAVLHGIPVGIVHADKPRQFAPWFAALQSAGRRPAETVWASLAMAQDFYLTWGRRFARWMRCAAGDGISVRAWLADGFTRDEVCQFLAGGPSLAVYCGHGRARGWSGYRALRWEHIAAAPLARPVGVMISLACDTLRRTRGVFPFGCRWVSEGRSCTYVGSVARLGVTANVALAQVLGEILARGRCRTIGKLLAAVDCHLASRPHMAYARSGFSTYRLIGNPMQSFV